MSDTNSLEPDLFAGHWEEKEFAKQRKKSERFLRLERQRGDGPPHIRDGRKIYYPIRTAREWLTQKMCSPARERQPLKADRVSLKPRRVVSRQHKDTAQPNAPAGRKRTFAEG
jgi:hypothetical protein